jgi:predicted RecA/RadA family phage recombinase
MSKLFAQPGDVITLAAPYDRTAGQGALVGAIFGVAMNDVLNTVNGQFAIEGVHTLAKATGQTWTQGALIYWDNTNKNCTTTSTSNTRIGCAMQAQASGDTTGAVRLNGIATPTGA